MVFSFGIAHGRQVGVAAPDKAWTGARKTVLLPVVLGAAFRPESGGRFSALRGSPREAGKSVVIFLLLLRLEEPGP
jgi:hypothetical protein